MPIVVSKQTAPVRALGNEHVLVAGNFTGGASPVVNDLKLGITVTRNGAGDYSLVLPGRGSVDVVSCQLTPVADTNQEFTAVVESITASTRTIVINTFEGGVQGDLGLGAVHFLIVVKESSY